MRARARQGGLVFGLDRQAVDRLLLAAGGALGRIGYGGEEANAVFLDAETALRRAAKHVLVTDRLGVHAGVTGGDRGNESPRDTVVGLGFAWSMQGIRRDDGRSRVPNGRLGRLMGRTPVDRSHRRSSSAASGQVGDLRSKEEPDARRKRRGCATMVAPSAPEAHATSTNATTAQAIEVSRDRPAPPCPRS